MYDVRGAAESSIIVRPIRAMAIVTPAAQVHADTCLCPGKGNVVRYTLEISLISVPNVPGAQTKMKTLIGVNGSSPGPTLTATENDWVGK